MSDPYFGPHSKLESRLEISEGILLVISRLLIDFDPTFEEEANKFIFRIFSTIREGGTGEEDLDKVLRDKWDSFSPPKLEWTAVIEAAEIAPIAHVIFRSRDC
jgi:hypothetical protein